MVKLHKEGSLEDRLGHARTIATLKTPIMQRLGHAAHPFRFPAKSRESGVMAARAIKLHLSARSRTSSANERHRSGRPYPFPARLLVAPLSWCPLL